MKNTTQTIYGLVSDSGDGSSCIKWFRNESLVERLLDIESVDDDNSFWANEGSPAETLTFPADLDLEMCGFSFSDGYYENREE